MRRTRDREMIFYQAYLTKNKQRNKHTENHIERKRNKKELHLHHYTALLWQKEASDIQSKSELLIFFSQPSVLFFQAKFHA